MAESLRILVAEDLPDNVQLLKLAFSKAGGDVPLNFVRDGAQAIDYLKGEAAFSNRNKYPLPTMLLLDLRMPRLDGFEVLKWLRLQPGLRRLVVVVFSSSDEANDINRAYDLGANSYIVKPASFTKLEETLRNLEEYWFKLNACPDCLPEQTSALPVDAGLGPQYPDAVFGATAEVAHPELRA